jgi:DNA-binding NarL/FixJ family response regulator
VVLPLVERHRPEIVALELGMHGEAGRSCLDLLRTHHPEVTVVALSASSAYDDIRSALARGARAFIVKNINPRDIPAALRHAHEETVYHAIGSEPGPEDQLRAAA